MSRGKDDQRETGVRQRILEAAIGEFGEKGYQKASTNAIAKAAGVAKGLLFYYFGSKKNLYLDTVDYCINYYVDYFLKHLGHLSRDFLERVTQWSTLKVKMFYQSPSMYRLSLSTMQPLPLDLQVQLAERYQKVTDKLMPIFLDGINFSSLRPGVDPQKALQLVLWVLDTIGRRFIESARTSTDQGLTSLAEVLKEMEEYLQMLKYGLYRQDEGRPLSS